MAKTGRPQVLLKLRIDGPGIRSGGITVPDLVAICDQAQSAVNRQAEAMEGRQALRPGPKTAKVRQECTLELVGLGKGSTTLHFALAKPQQPLPIPHMTTFGAEVVARVASTVKSLTSRKKASDGFDPGVMDSLKTMGDVFEKRSITRIEWVVPRADGRAQIRAIYTKTGRARVAEWFKAPSHRVVTVEGTLEMADFKQTDQKCRIHPPLGSAVICTFEKDKADEIYSLLRKSVRLSGEATVNPHTARIESVQVRNLTLLEPLSLGARDFFSGKTIQELAAIQGVRPLEDVSLLAGGWPDEENVDEVLEEIYRQRE